MSEERQQFTLPDLIDNCTPDCTLSHILNQLLATGPAVHIATGFFNLGGYALLRDGLQRASRVRLLLGKEPVASEAGPEALPPVEELIEAVEADLHVAMATGRRAEHDRVRDFLAFLQQPQVEVRLYSRRFFHAKAYILDGVPPFGTIAIVGSSHSTGVAPTGTGLVGSEPGGREGEWRVGRPPDGGTTNLPLFREQRGDARRSSPCK